LVQNVVEMQDQVAEMEIEVEVWQAMAHQGSSCRLHHQLRLPLLTSYREFPA
jgi:hypothetical protein